MERIPSRGAPGGGRASIGRDEPTADTGMTRPFVLSLIATVFAAQALAGQVALDSLPPGVTLDMVERGSALFHGRGMCVNCHGADATGLLGPDLTDGEWLRAKGSYLSILRVVLNGVSTSETQTGAEMPARGGLPLDDVDVQAVAAWVWALSHPQATDSLPHGTNLEMVRRGETVFHADGGCVRCHGADATGDLGPDLTDNDWLQAKGSYLAIVNQVLTGVSEESSTTGIPMPPRGGGNLSDNEVHDVAAYVWRISHRPRP